MARDVEIEKVQKELERTRTRLEVLDEINYAMIECLDVLQDRIDKMREERKLDVASKTAVELDGIVNKAFGRRFYLE